MHAYRTHNCAQLTKSDVGETVRLSGWIHRKRDHGGVLFVDLRDHNGLTQIVADEDSTALKTLDNLRLGKALSRSMARSRRARQGTTNANLSTGDIEVFARSVTIQSRANELPLPVAGEQEYPEDIRLKYRFLDLRRERVHANIMLRNRVITSLRRRMTDQGFTEFQTPILGASSPGRRARLSGPQPPASRQFLRAAAGSADVQAAADGGRVRSLFPDRPVFSR